MNWLKAARNTRSSYMTHDLGWVFYSLARAYKPRLCVEIGVFRGYSAIFTLAALKDNRAGEWYGFDLFDNYAYTHCTPQEAQKNIESAGLAPNLVKLDRGQKACDHPKFPGNHENPAESKIDFAHIDISNNGDIWWEYLDVMSNLITPGGLLVFEGGSKERDEVEWMQKYKFRPMSPIVNEFKDDPFTDVNWELFLHIGLFPSLTVFQRV